MAGHEGVVLNRGKGGELVGKDCGRSAEIARKRLMD